MGIEYSTVPRAVLRGASICSTKVYQIPCWWHTFLVGTDHKLFLLLASNIVILP